MRKGKEYSRTDRIAELIGRQLAVLVQREIRDPRLGMVTISHVKVTRDLAFATVYVTVMDGSDKDKSLAALNHAAGYLRRLLADSIKIRTLPALTFVYDEALYRGMRVASIIEKNLPPAADDPNKNDDESSLTDKNSEE
jgi:ribosome-binding factor A